MKRKLNVKRVVLVSILGGIAVGLVLPTAIDFVLDALAHTVNGMIDELIRENNTTSFTTGS